MSGWWHKLLGRKGSSPELAVGRAESVQTKASVCSAQGDPGPTRRVTIGLDFGTSTTKCCLHEDQEAAAFHFLAFRDPRTGGSAVLMPTTVTWCGEKLLFGAAAEQAAYCETVRSFKMCLLCQSQAASQSAHSSDCPNCRPERRGWFRLASEEFSAEELCTLYVAYVLGLAKQAAPFLLRGRRDNLKLFVNSAAPLDQMEAFGAVGEYFDRMVHYAWHLAGRVTDGIALTTARQLLREAGVEPRPAKEQSHTRVFPETHAAMTGYLLLPQSESGLYGLVDVGAGTTDVAYFWLQKDDRETKAWYYAAGSERIGMDDVDRALLDVLQSNARNVRNIRESMPPSELVMHNPLIEPVAKRINSHQANILDQARKVDRREIAWRDRGKARYRLFLAGGGTVTAAIQERLTKNSPIAPTWAESPRPLVVSMSNKAVFPDGTIASLDSACHKEAARLLLLSYGLAHRQVDIPKYDRDADGVTKEKEPGPDVDPPTGHWW